MLLAIKFHLVNAHKTEEKRKKEGKKNDIFYINGHAASMHCFVIRLTNTFCVTMGFNIIVYTLTQFIQIINISFFFAV